MAERPWNLERLGQERLSQEALLDLWISSTKTERLRLFCDSKTASELVGISQRAVRFWIESGQISAIRIGKKYQIYAQSLKKSLLVQISENQ